MDVEWKRVPNFRSSGHPCRQMIRGEPLKKGKGEKRGKKSISGRKEEEECFSNERREDK